MSDCPSEVNRDQLAEVGVRLSTLAEKHLEDLKKSEKIKNKSPGWRHSGLFLFLNDVNYSSADSTVIGPSTVCT